MTRPATQQEADLFRGHLFTVFHGTPVPRELISSAFQSILGLDPTKWITAQALTLGPLVWMRDGLSPDEQIEAITHECSFLDRFWDSPLQMAWLYASNGEARARYAAQAMAALLEVTYARKKQLPSFQECVERMKRGHFLDSDNVLFAADLLESAVTSIAGGSVGLTRPGDVAVRYLRVNAPELLA